MRLQHSILIALVIALSTSTSANAHDVLIDIQPAEGAIIQESSFEAILTFNNPLLEISGQSNVDLETRLEGSSDWKSHPVVIDNRTLTAQIELSDSGNYELRWMVVSSDGHQITGNSSFVLSLQEEEGPVEQTEAPVEENVIATAPEQTNPTEGSLVGFYIGLGMVVLGAVFAPIGMMMRRRARKS